MHPYNQEIIEWELALSNCTDEELISRHNDSVGIRCYGLGRSAYLNCLQKEILSRDFDSSILFGRDKDGKVTSYRLSHKVSIMAVNGCRVLVVKPDLINDSKT